MALEKELEYFKAHREEFVQHYEGQFVLIKGDSFLGSFTTEQEAYQAGIAKIGNQPFLIKKVTRDEDITHLPAVMLGLLSADIQ